MSQQWPGQREESPQVQQAQPMPAPQQRPVRTAPVGIPVMPSPRQERLDKEARARADRAQRNVEFSQGLALEAARRAEEALNLEKAKEARIAATTAAKAPNIQDLVGSKQEQLQRTESVIGVLSDIRGLSQQNLSTGRVAGGVSATPVVGALLGQNRANLEAALATLEGDIIQVIAGEMAERNEGGVSKLLDNPEEQRRAIASIANLDPNQTPEQFLKGLDRAENFLRRRRDRLTQELAPAEGTGQENAPPPPPENFTVGGFTPRTGPMDRIEFEAQLSELLRRGASAELINRWAPTTGQTLPNQRQLLEAIEAYRGGYRGPVQTYERGNATISPQSIGSFVSGVADIPTFNFTDEGIAAARALFNSDTTYAQEWQRQQAMRAADNEGARSLGQLTGVVATAPLTLASGLLNAPTLAGQAIRGAGFGAGTNALAGIGAAPMDNRFQTLGTDIAVGTGFGAAAPTLARLGSEAVQVVGNFFPGGSNRQANRALGELQIDPAELRRRAEEYVRVTGRPPRIADLLEPSEAQRLQRNLAPADDAVARATREATQEVENLPRTVSARVEQGGPIEGPSAAGLRTRAQGDIDFGGVRNVGFPVDPVASAYFERVVLPQSGLTPLGRQQALAELEQGTLSGNILDIVRKNLRARDRANPGEGFGAIADEIEGFMAAQDPRAAEAIDRFARNATRAEAVELGQRAVSPQQAVNFPEDVAAMRYQGTSTGRDVSGEITEGLALGARSAAWREAMANPGKAYRLLQEIDTSPAVRNNLVQALGADEAQRLIDFAQVQRRAVDSLSAVSGVPVNQVASQLDDAKALVDTAVAAGRGAGGAMVSGMLQRTFVERFGLGQGPARRLAEKLFEPGQYGAVIRTLEKRARGMSRRRVEEVLRDQLIRNFAQADSRQMETSIEANRQQLER